MPIKALNPLIFRFHRTMTRPFFTRDRISHFDMFDANADSALKQARARLAEGYPIDFQVMYRTGRDRPLALTSQKMCV